MIHSVLPDAPDKENKRFCTRDDQCAPIDGCTPAISDKPQPARAGCPHTDSHGLHRVKK
jgi:hypothetical protein